MSGSEVRACPGHPVSSHYVLKHVLAYWIESKSQWWALYFPSSMRTFVWSDLVFSLPHVHLVLIHFGKACSLLGLTHSNPVSVSLVLHRPASSSYLFLVRDTELSSVVSSYLNQSIAHLLCWEKAHNNKKYVCTQFALFISLKYIIYLQNLKWKFKELILVFLMISFLLENVNFNFNLLLTVCPETVFISLFCR